MKRFGYIALLLVLGLVTTSCYKATGGGFVEYCDGEKAHFAFTYQMDPDTEEVKGQLTFHDGDIKIKGVITQVIAGSDDSVTVKGEYRTQPPGGEGGFELFVKDNGEPGVDEDIFQILLWGDVNYLKYGKIDGGNIQVNQN